MDVGVARVGVACLAGLFGDVGAFGRPAPRQTRDGRRALLVFGVIATLSAVLLAFAAGRATQPKPSQYPFIVHNFGRARSDRQGCPV